MIGLGRTLLIILVVLQNMFLAVQLRGTVDADLCSRVGFAGLDEIVR